MPSEFAADLIRDYKLTDRKWVTDANVRHYERIEGFDPSFAEAVSTALDQLEDKLDDDNSKFLIVDPGETRQPVGCASSRSSALRSEGFACSISRSDIEVWGSAGV